MRACVCVQVTSSELGGFREATDVQPCLNFHNKEVIRGLVRLGEWFVRLGGVVS